MPQLLSVVIITCNRETEIIKAMDSCLRHTDRDIEFVVVDNNSSDNTESVIEEYKQKNNLDLKYIKLSENTGVSHARNVGFRESTGDILFFIDDDAVVVSNNNSLDTVSDYLRNHDGVFACTGESLDSRYGGNMPFIRSKNDNAEDYFQIRSFVGFNHFIKKGFTDRDYIYPDNLFYGSEELYVGLSVLKYGGKIVYCSNHTVQHYPSSNTRIDRNEGIKNGHINTYVIKSYFLSGVYGRLSRIMFLLRIARFCNYSIKEIYNCYRIAKERYDGQYDNKMTMSQISKAIACFGRKAIL